MDTPILPFPRTFGKMRKKNPGYRRYGQAKRSKYGGGDRERLEEYAKPPMVGKSPRLIGSYPNVLIAWFEAYRLHCTGKWGHRYNIVYLTKTNEVGMVQPSVIEVVAAEVQY